MLATLGALLLCAAPVKVAVPSFNLVGIDAALGEAWVDRFITLLSRDGDLALITNKDIGQVLGLERQKQMLGCSEGQSSCLAELAGALGVDAILSGTVAQSGASISATLRVLKASDGSQIAAATGRLKDVDALQDWLDAQAGELAQQLRTAFKLPSAGAPPPAVSASAKSTHGTGVVRWVPALAGAVAALTGGALFGMSKGNAARLGNEVLTRDQITSTVSAGRSFEAAGLGLMIGGGVAIAASLAWVALAPSAQVSVAVVASPSGAAAAIGGSF